MKNELNEFLGKHRKQFEKNELMESNTPAEPFELFNLWLKQAIEHALEEPYAMSLATCIDNVPSQRIVYVREVHTHGLVFFSNYLSKKGIESGMNANASLLFFWAEAERQIRLEGKVRIAEAKISNDYFDSRPRNSQLGAWASEQSKVIESRSVLDERMKHFEQQFEGKSVPRPEHWGGFFFEPHYFEFWQGRTSRLHDRITYQKSENNWAKKRLAP